MNFAGIRFTTVGIILFAYTWHKGMWREIRQHSKLFLNLILINMFMGYTAFYFGVDFVSGAISSIIMGMTPLINVLLAHLLASNDRLNTHKIISLIVSLIGLFLIIGMGSNGAPLDWKGITGIVLFTVKYYLSRVFCYLRFRRQRKGESYFPECGADVLRRSAYIYGGLGHWKVIILLSENPADFMPALRYWYSYLVFAFSFWFIALQSKGAKVSDINMCRLINPILGAVLSWIMLAGEIPHFQYGGRNVDYRQLTDYLFQGAEIAKYFSTRKR